MREDVKYLYKLHLTKGFHYISFTSFNRKTKTPILGIVMRAEAARLKKLLEQLREVKKQMKVRQGFVSNSSSSSFIIDKQNLTGNQIGLIHDHIRANVIERCKGKIANNDKIDALSVYSSMLNGVSYSWEFSSDEWNIWEDDGKLCGSTMMDNFDMMFFLEMIGVDEDKIKWDY